MSTQVLGRSKRSRVIAAVIALAFTLTVFLLATEASSIRSTTIVPPAKPATAAPVRITLSHMPPGCRPKYGCDHKAHSANQP
jgi:hypothetical protein